MSKSLGNVIDVAAVQAMGIRLVELRYYLGTPHYRSRIDYSDEALREAAVAYRRRSTGRCCSSRARPSTSTRSPTASA